MNNSLQSGDVFHALDQGPCMASVACLEVQNGLYRLPTCLDQLCVSILQCIIVETRLKAGAGLLRCRGHPNEVQIATATFHTLATSHDHVSCALGFCFCKCQGLSGTFVCHHGDDGGIREDTVSVVQAAVMTGDAVRAHDRSS